MKTPYRRSGNIINSSVIDSINLSSKNRYSQPLRLGIVADVYTVDNTDDIVSPQGAYTLYSIRLNPGGHPIENVPAVMMGGHLNSSINFPGYGDTVTNTPQPPISVQNIDETPYFVGQYVLLAFINGSILNPVIIGGLPVSSSLIPDQIGQTKADYPKKYGQFQGTKWSIDKNGNTELDIPITSTVTIKFGGNILCYLKNGEIDLGSDNSSVDLQPTILGDKLKQFLDSVFSSLSGHTHSGVSTGMGTSGPPLGVTVPSDMETTVVKVK